MTPTAQEALSDFEEARNAQRRAALVKARNVRTQRRLVKEALKSGEIDVYEVLEGQVLPEIEAVIAEIPVFDMLRMLPGIGKVRALEIVNAFEASPATVMCAFDKGRRRELSLIVKGARETMP